ncbi:MAG: C40 family peptidase [Saprospiraceae bacterium]|jgi:cell wall-associated NlpC family hydrolase|nr:C40 family peptidase [Saprospiraceae bacterium]
MITNKISLFFVVGICIALMMASCSTSNTYRSGKYSSAGKREKSDSKKSSEKAYTYEKKPGENKKEDKSQDVSGIRLDIINTALSYIGTTYRSGGKSPESGFDCSGFTGYVFSQNGIPLAGSSDNLARLGKEKNRDDLAPGDLVFFGNEQRISHVAIVSENLDKKLKVVHATTSAGVKTDVITDYAYWESRFLFGKDILSK